MSAHPDPAGQPTAGFIGLGNIGAPMARCLTSWPGGLVVCDALPDACTPLVDAGATAAATPAELARTATVISVMVRDDAQVRDVVAGPDGILSTAAPGTVIAVHSTIHADTAIQLADEAADADVHVIDAPVSGGSMGAHDGTLAIMVGGADDALALARPVLEALGALIVHAGPVGAGTRAKVARNLVTFVSYAVVGEAQRLAEAAGLPLGPLGDVVRHSDRITGGPGAIWLRDETGPLPDEDPLRPIFEHACGLGEKDLALAIDLADELGLDLPLTRLATDLLAPALGVPHERDPTRHPEEPA